MKSHSWKFVLAFALFVVSTTVIAQEEKSNEEDIIRYFSIYEENDVFGIYHTDQYYTQGFRLEWTWHNINPETSSPWIPFIQHLYDSRSVTYLNGFAIAQNMYTPNIINPTILNLDDRPFAGWSYAGLVIRALDVSNTYMDTYEIDIGVVGPQSLAEDFQQSLHRFIDGTNPNWLGQLDNDFTFGISFTKQWSRYMESMSTSKETGWKSFLIHSTGVRLGNELNYINLGLKMIFGYNATNDFHAGEPNIAIETSALANSCSKKWGAYCHMGIVARTIFYNVFLDRDAYSPPRYIEPETLGGDFFFGVTLKTPDNIKFSFTRIWRLPEWQTQEQMHHFGNISISFAF